MRKDWRMRANLFLCENTVLHHGYERNRDRLRRGDGFSRREQMKLLSLMIEKTIPFQQRIDLIDVADDETGISCVVKARIGAL